MSVAWRKTQARIQLIGGELMEGTLVISREERLSDFLNNPKKLFVALQDASGQVFMLNKQHIVKVTELRADNPED